MNVAGEKAVRDFQLISRLVKQMRSGNESLTVGEIRALFDRYPEFRKDAVDADALREDLSAALRRRMREHDEAAEMASALIRALAISGNRFAAPWAQQIYQNLGEDRAF